MDTTKESHPQKETHVPTNEDYTYYIYAKTISHLCHP